MMKQPVRTSMSDFIKSNMGSQFVIPVYQRNYTWNPENETMRFLNDIEDLLEGNTDHHFLGILIYIESEVKTMFKEIQIVDGQQRLTTTLLFLIALRDNESDSNTKEYITTNYLTNNTSSFQDKIKLKQVSKDWDAYRALINGTAVNSGIIKGAYDIFSRLIENQKRLRPEIKTEHYILALRRLNVAVIFLDERPFKGEDPQIIFETLNSLGKPLTLSDLIRNYVLLNMNSENQSEIYENTWYPRIEQVLKDKASDFFRDFLQLKTANPIKVVSDNNTKEIYAAFKDFVLENYPAHKDFIDDIVSYVKPYKWIINEEYSDTISANKANDEEIKELLKNIFHDIKSEAFKPLVMGLLHCHQNQGEEGQLSDEALISQLETIRTYLIRRRIAKLTQGENKNVVLLCGKINDLVNGKIELLKLLSTMFYKLRLPNDDEIKQLLLTANFYEDFKSYSKFILGKIEQHNAPKSAIAFRKLTLSIEHIMPQTLSDEWKEYLGADYEEISKKYLHNIGNLILTEFNSEMGNKPFSEKQKKLNESCLHYRLDILSTQKWNEDAIKAHQEKMINWFLETFLLPDEYKNASNWNTKVSNEQDSKEFSPLDDEAGEIAEGNKPVFLKIGTTVFKVSSWVEVFVKFMKYIHNSDDYDFQLIIENQEELFGKKVVVIRNWASLREFLVDNENFSTRYKSLDGLLWDKIENLKDDEIFVHTNISAEACMNRIARVMNKFNIENDFVTITLK